MPAVSWAVGSLGKSRMATGRGISLARRTRSPRAARKVEDLGAIGIYVMAWLLLIGRHAVLDPTHTCACVGTQDPASYMWSFVWWPHALAHGLNPFISHVVWTPTGANVAVAALAPAASLLFAPITEPFGPIASYNLLSLLAPVLGAWFTFRLCRYVTRAWLPSLVGGYIFGFSSYELGQELGHLNLICVFLVPAAVHLVLLRMDDKVSSRRFVAVMGGIFGLQYLLSTEILVSMLGLGSVTLALAYAFSPSERRDQIRAIALKLLVAGAASALVVSPMLFYAVKGLGPNPSINWLTVENLGSADPLNYVVPTPITWLGHSFSESLAAQFNSANYSESGAYLGVPLVAIVVIFLISNRRRPVGKILLGTLLVAGVASFGPHLHIATLPRAPDLSFHPSIPLPWLAIERIPVLDHVLPVRLSVYVFLGSALIVAMWLTQPSRRSWPKWILAAGSVLLLLPNLSAAYWRGRPPDPRFFTGTAYKRYLKPQEVALVFPFGENGDSMLWQAETHMYFRMAEGYVGQETPLAFWRQPVVHNFYDPSGVGPVPPMALGDALRVFVEDQRVSAVIIGPGGSGPGPWPSVLASLGLHAKAVDGVLFYAIPTSWQIAPGSVPPAPVAGIACPPPVTPASHAGPAAGPLHIVSGRVAGIVDHAQILGSSVYICGWAAGVRDRRVADTVVVFADGRLVATVKPTVSRPDIAQAAPGVGNTSGYSVQLPLAALEPGGMKARLQIFGIERGTASLLPIACASKPQDFGC